MRDGPKAVTALCALMAAVFLSPLSPYFPDSLHKSIAGILEVL